jgi:hypothetical protein
VLGDRVVLAATFAHRTLDLTGVDQSFQYDYIADHGLPEGLAHLPRDGGRIKPGVYHPSVSKPGAIDVLLVLPCGVMLALQCKTSRPLKECSCAHLTRGDVDGIEKSCRTQLGAENLKLDQVPVVIVTNRGRAHAVTAATLPDNMAVITRRGLRTFCGYAVADAFLCTPQRRVALGTHGRSRYTDCAKVSVNSGTRAELQAVLWSDEAVEAILRRRAVRAIASMDELRELLPHALWGRTGDQDDVDTEWDVADTLTL